MKGKCHKLLGQYLAQKYMTGAPRRYTWAFRLGCIEPDKNPTTYFKGSLRSQWLRGHNWGNAQNYMHRVSRRLERKSRLNLLDFYALGKLIHYTTDAFTYAHNESFGEDLQAHCHYEQALKRYFPQYLATHREESAVPKSTVMETIRACHRDYNRRPTGIYNDSRFSVTACCLVVSLLLAKQAV